MILAAREPTFQDYFANLQEGMVTAISLLGSAAGYLWLAANIWGAYLARSSYDPSPSLTSWVGSGVLLISAILAFVWRGSRLRLAAHLLAWGILGAVACAVLGIASLASAAAYLFIVPILFASALLSQTAFALVAGAAFVLTLEAGLGRAGISLGFAEVGSPMVTLALVTLAAWLSTRRLYTALQWVWSGYEQARHNETVARDRQAELERTLKALDEASYRLERANYLLAIARDQAEEARRLKQQFAQTVSHELRTPLNLIVGFTELMIQSPEYYGEQLSARYLRDLRIVHRNACHLQTLVNDVLDLARLEAAQMALVQEEADPAALVREAVNTARSLIESQGLALRLDIEPDLPPLWVDPTRIRQVLFNLLNNAARFTDKGSVTVSVRRREALVIFSVADTGTGIPEGQLGLIFDDFHQADGGTQRRHDGAGLGLAISKRFVALHGGHIWVESQVGVGSTFYFSLPVAREDWDATTMPPTVRAAGAISGAESEKPVLLAVTRSLAASTMLARYVHGCNTVIAPDLAQAQTAAARLLPQAVVVDQAERTWTPGDLEEIARAWGIPQTPVMACPLPGEGSMAQRLEVEGYLVKPISRQALWDVLRQFGEKVDHVLVVDDAEDFVQLMGRLLDSPVRRYRMTSAYSGQEALAMMQRRRPDLVLLDIRLPDISGPELVKQMRARPEWRDIPIVIVTAQDEPDVQESQPGSITIARGAPWVSAEVIRWVQNLVGVTAMPALRPAVGLPAPVEPPRAPVR